MKALYIFIGFALLIGICQESAAISLTAAGVAIGMYLSLKKNNPKAYGNE